MEPIERKPPQLETQPVGEERLLRAGEIMRMLNVSRATAYRMMADGSMPVYRFGGRDGHRAIVRVALRDLEQWKEEQKRPPSHEDDEEDAA